MEKENEKINKCSKCKTDPKIADVGGYIPCIEICCINCGKAVHALTLKGAITKWNTSNSAIKKE